ncbi:MAG: DNA polymerase/3'-5' exonuclease PolX [Candidatus Saganbacteria bacterium]|nr:DNA polymerase/3'-5' exonuclease PolX [Candidatus Saganbacteria bacterium]
MDNQQIAKYFYDIAKLLEIKDENPFRIRSYQKAAQTIEAYPESIEDIYNSGGIEELKKITGIGDSISHKIGETIERGHPKIIDELFKEEPKGLLGIMDIQGIGPKFTKMVYKELGIRNVNDLEKAAKSGKLRGLPGVEKKRIENIIKGIDSYKTRASKHYIGDVLPFAKEIESILKRSRCVKKILICGSLRRMKENIGDIDILATSDDRKAVMDVFTKLPQVRDIVAKGDTKSSVSLKNGMDSDLRVVDEESFGAASNYFTGSKQHNIKMRHAAIKKGLKLNEYGVFKGKRCVAGRSEGEVFKALGMQFIPPEIREDSGEVELAQKRKLPTLIELSDIKGDFHVHSNYSDGSDTIEEIAKAAKKLGYEFITISDHSKSTKIAGGLTEKELLKQMGEIDRLNRKIKGIRILKGSEVDILPDGSLDFDDEILKKLDVVVASVHSRFGMGEDEMTGRIIKAMENKFVTIIGHPTGRLLSRRDPYKLDIDRLAAAAKKYGKALELNCYPDRLDLSDINCRLAKEKDVKIAIGTDSHSAVQLSHMELGIGIARRGWLGKKDVLNCRTY